MQPSQLPKTGARTFFVRLQAGKVRYHTFPEQGRKRGNPATYEITRQRMISEINARLQKPAVAPYVMALPVLFTLILLLNLASTRTLVIVTVIDVACIVAAYVMHKFDLQMRASRIHFSLDATSKQRLEQFNLNISSLESSRRLWQITQQITQANRKGAYGAIKLVTRAEVRFGVLTAPMLASNLRLHGLQLAQTRILFLPDQVLVYERGRYRSIDYNDFVVDWSRTTFTEEQPVPDDSQVLNYVWRHARIDGEADRRFKDNARLPIVEYGQVLFYSLPMFGDEFISVHLHVSNLRASKYFADGVQQYVSWLTGKAPPFQNESREETAREGRAGHGEKARSSRKQARSAAPLTPHEVLGVFETATFADIQKAYRNLAQKYHPDKVVEQPPDLQQYAAEKMKVINQAYADIRRTRGDS